MNRRELVQKVMWAVLIIILLVGCSAPAATPTSEASPEPVIEAGEIIFDGRDCTYSGLTELSTGRYSFVLKDLSDLDLYMWVSRMTDGKTYQDFVDLADPSNPYLYFPKEDWIDHAIELGMSQQRPDGGEVHTFILSVVGEYSIVVGRESPFYIAFCSPIWVLEDPSE